MDFLLKRAKVSGKNWQACSSDFGQERKRVCSRFTLLDEYVIFKDLDENGLVIDTRRLCGFVKRQKRVKCLTLNWKKALEILTFSKLF